MGRRITIFDQSDFESNYLRWWSIPLGDEIYSIQQLNGISDVERNNILTIGEGDAVLVASVEAWRMIRERYHVGVRNENFADCQMLTRLSVEGGAFLKCIPGGEFPSDEVVNQFMNPDFTKRVDYSWYKQKVIKTIEEAYRFLNWLDSLPEDTNFGFDYESSGKALDKWFELSGFSICTVKYGGFVSLTDIRHQIGKDSSEYIKFLKDLGKFLVKRMSHIWVYNMQYEFQVSFRMLGVDLYNLCDSGIYNVLDGYHLNKKYSLKWTAQRVLGVDVWDSEFDRISDLIDSMLFIEVGKLKAEKKKVLKVDLNNYKNTEEWRILCSRYPKYTKEFELLIEEYWGNPFMCIPSDILGYYCNLDSFYTLMIHEQRKSLYSPRVIDTFMDNFRLACRLHSCGIPKWEKYRLEYQEYCEKMMDWGITYCAAARCMIKMIKHKSLMANIDKYNPVCKILLKSNKFFNGDPVLILKDILLSHIDKFDATDTGLDEGKLMLSFGEDFALKFINILKESMVEVKMKGKIDETIVRKKKIIGILAEKLIPILGLDKLKLGNKHLELEKYLYYERAYNEIMKIYKTQMPDINHVPEEFYVMGTKMNRSDYYNFMCKNYFMCTSPIENDEICLELAKLYPSESAYIAALGESIQQLPNTDHFYSDLGINNIDDAYIHFQNAFTHIYKGGKPEETDYKTIKVFELAYNFYKDLKCDQIKDVWSDFAGYEIQEKLFPSIAKNYLIFEEKFDPTHLDNKFLFIQRMQLNYLLQKKNAKVLSTYLLGIFKKGDKCVIEDPKTHIMIREADPNEPGAVTKMTVHFECMEKSSKRWGSSVHTIISHSDIKSTLCSYGYGSGYGEEAFGGTNSGQLLSYFDISSAEVKSAGFQSGDPGLIDKFVRGEDIYIYCAKDIYLGQEAWDKLSKADKKKWRKRFKTIFLGILYGLGKNRLAAQLNCDIEEAERIIQSVYNAFPKLREYIHTQEQVPFNNNNKFHEFGNINTFFGDRLHLKEFDYYMKSKDQREKQNLEARIKRLAVNLPIQGGTSTAMSSGFFNDTRVAKQEGWALTSLLTVHDSNTGSFPAEKLWDIRKFFDKNFTDFCYDMTGIKLLFDILIGVTYQDACEAKQLSDDIVQLTGNARSHLMIIEQLNHCPGLKYEIDMPVDKILPNFIEDPMQRFIMEKGCSMIMDTSSYTIKYKKL